MQQNQQSVHINGYILKEKWYHVATIHVNKQYALEPRRSLLTASVGTIVVVQ